jgi:hypothetical protein
MARLAACRNGDINAQLGGIWASGSSGETDPRTIKVVLLNMRPTRIAVSIHLTTSASNTTLSPTA